MSEPPSHLPVPLVGRHTNINDVIPPELLSAILEEVMREYHSSQPPSAPGWTKVLLDLCRVCSYWRSVATTTPHLWHILHVKPTTPFQMVMAFITRSQTLPLDLDVQSCELSEGTGRYSILLLAGEFHRWRSCNWVAPADALSRLLETLNRRPTPLLEQLTLRGQGERPARILFDWSAWTPRLRNVHVVGVELNWSVLPFQNLRELELGRLPFNPLSEDQFTRLLRLCPELEILKLQDLAVARSGDLAFQQWNDEELDLAALVSLQSLRSLTLEGFSRCEPIEFISLIHAPNLEHLALIGIIGTASESFNHLLVSLLLASNAFGRFGRIQHLELRPFGCHNLPGFDTFLRFMTNLRTLDIEAEPVVMMSEEAVDPNTFIQVFHDQKGRAKCDFRDFGKPLLCPFLEELRTTGFSEDVLASISLSRLHAGSPLRRLTCGDRDLSVVEDDVSPILDDVDEGTPVEAKGVQVLETADDEDRFKRPEPLDLVEMVLAGLELIAAVCLLIMVMLLDYC